MCRVRSVYSIFSALLLAVAVQLASPAPSSGQVPDRKAAYLEWQSIANGRTDFEVSDANQVPSLLATAAKQSGCHYEEISKVGPLRFLSVEKRRLALMPCFGFNGSNELFDFTDLTKPMLLEFPVIAQPEGFGTTSWPGAITWKPETKLFEAESSTDLCPSSKVRHTYRFTDPTYRPGLIVVKVERQADRCAASPWIIVWEASRW